MNSTKHPLMRPGTVIAWFSLLGLLLLMTPVQAEEIRTVKSFYFGNSFTGNTMPGLHPLLGKSAGREWITGASVSAGVPLWAHMKELMDKAPSAVAGLEGDYDVVVGQLFGGQGQEYITESMWQGKVKFDKPTDIGDIASATYIFKEFLKAHPDARAYIYTSWPGIPMDELATELGVTAEGEKKNRKGYSEEQMEMFRKAFDYEKEWLARDYFSISAPMEQRERLENYGKALKARPKKGETIPTTIAELAAATGVGVDTVTGDLELVRVGEKDLANPMTADKLFKFASGCPHTHSRPHTYAVMEGVKNNLPEAWAAGRLGMIPVGDVFFELDKKMKAGEVPGLVNIGQYLSNGHLRSGLPRYTLGATFYAVLFKEHPGKTDINIYGDRSNYESKKFGKFYVHQPDLGEHVEITPERKKIVDDTIWEVVTQHPYALVGNNR